MFADDEHSEPLSELLTLFPRAKDEFTRQLSRAFPNIADQEFRVVKDRICLFKELALLLEREFMNLAKRDYTQVLKNVLEGDVDQARASVKRNSAGIAGDGKNSKKTFERFIRPMKTLFFDERNTEDISDNLFQRARDAAQNVTDSQFLFQLGDDLERFSEYEEQLKTLADVAKGRALAHLEFSIAAKTNKLTQAVHRIQQEDSKEQIKREQTIRAEEEQRKLRVDLIRQINNLSTHTTHTQVLIMIRSNGC